MEERDMTRTEKRLLNLSNKRKRLMQRIVKASTEHKARQELYGRLVEATAAQIRTELALERKARAA